MANIGRPPCDEGVVRASRASAPCTPASAPWVLGATIIGSAMAFIDGTITNVALPQIQERLGASAVDAQWIVEAYTLFLAALILVGGSLGDHYGLGPVIAATGFVLFAIPGTTGSYWTTFCPAVVVLGLGISLVIAPLTTTAMNSVEGRHSGLASGVNNAVSRAAGLLAIPLLGIFVCLTFSVALDARTASLALPPQARQQLEAEKVDLGAAQVPEGVSGETAASVEGAVAESFGAGFRVAMVAAAILAVASAAASALIIEGKGSARRTQVETAPA